MTTIFNKIEGPEKDELLTILENNPGVFGDGLQLIGKKLGPRNEPPWELLGVRKDKKLVLIALETRMTDRTIVKLLRNIDWAWENLETARAQIRSFSAEVRAAEIALEGVQQEALVGSRTVLDVLDAEQELLDARVSLVRAERDEIVAAYQLRSSVGRLTAESLDLPVKRYDFTKNYRRVRNKWFGLGIDKE